MHMIWVLIIGAVVGAIAGAITSRGMPMGWIGNIIAGLVGSWLGEAVLGSWGPSLAGMSLIPSLIGAIVLVLIVSLIVGSRNKQKA
ncbi:GlsB/YeaQ/YmgE family stress response membrane protein [Agrilactobacillus fermenti]|uniref:GlsB/YeaQ/YmgE family stress response membrane protein n=1 Tax=Agrilactobacillus fermenti TaxID=2586909 RepID=UPI001E4831E6|nr:GlsB/YeaQ/YmgE family stress response membrane protein [Agrilactobacillus fermenti]MCD2255639.1 GlsB/YeaQ/YmgE family stress response membrane protein [Agrilactobacillus fermenti]